MCVPWVSVLSRDYHMLLRHTEVHIIHVTYKRDLFAIQWAYDRRKVSGRPLDRHIRVVSLTQSTTTMRLNATIQQRD